ncbi:hypothetical protein LTR74_004009 [Friedmanniomyces endolithicus]|nr:hypothetical protein LTR74_004009 [Friedmanniomyces endolithicus]
MINGRDLSNLTSITSNPIFTPNSTNQPTNRPPKPNLATMPYYSVHKRAPTTPLTTTQEHLKTALIATGEPWTPTWHNLLLLDPTYFAAYTRLRSAAVHKPHHLPRKTQELLLLALDAPVTHLHDHGIQAHTTAAVHAGATREEILETLELVSVLGVHAVTVGMPLLQEVLAERGESIEALTAVTPQQEKLKEEFRLQRGYYSPSWDAVVALSPEFFAAYTAFSAVPFKHGSHNHLEPKVKELIFVAIDAATTHLYAPGLKIHMRNAMQCGATKEEVMEVLELAAGMGVVSVLRGVEALTEDLEPKK